MAINVLLVTQTVPHYREKIYELLCGNEQFGIRYYLAADEHSKDRSLKVLSKGNLSDASNLKTRWTIYPNLWIKGTFLWQPNLLIPAISRKYDVVIMTGDVHYLSTWVIAAVRRLLKRPTLMWTHGLLKPEGGLKLVIRRIFYSLANGLLLYGNRAKDLLIDAGLAAEKLDVVYNSLDYAGQTTRYRAVDPRQIVEIRNKLGIEEEQQVIITTGRLTAAKKIEALIEVLPHLAEPTPPCLLIVGDGPERDRLKMLAAQNQVQDRVIFFGACYDETQLATLMKASDVFVLPGDAGLSVIHGLTYGVPVITHDNMNSQKPEVEAIRDNVNGSFYRARDLSDLAGKIQYWLLQARKDKQGLTNRCQEVVHKYYNPSKQLQIINQAVRRTLTKQ